MIGFVSLAVLLAKWKDLMVTFFDENHARTIGLQAWAAESSVLCAAVGIRRGGDADRWRVSW